MFDIMAACAKHGKVTTTVKDEATGKRVTLQGRPTALTVKGLVALAETSPSFKASEPSAVVNGRLVQQKGVVNNPLKQREIMEKFMGKEEEEDKKSE